MFSSKGGFDRFEKQVHLLISRDAGDDEPEVATPGRSRIIDKRRVNAISQQEAVKPLIFFFVVKRNRENGSGGLGKIDAELTKSALQFEGSFL